LSYNTSGDTSTRFAYGFSQGCLRGVVGPGAVRGWVAPVTLPGASGAPALPKLCAHPSFYPVLKVSSSPSSRRATFASSIFGGEMPPAEDTSTRTVNVTDSPPLNRVRTFV